MLPTTKTAIMMAVAHTNTSEHAERILRIKDGLIQSDEAVKNRRLAQDGAMIK